MRFASSVFAASCLVATSLSSVSAAGVCGLTVTCAQNTTTYRPCSTPEAADFKLVATALQSCKDVSYYFTQGESWPINDKDLFCRVDSVCGKLVPYIRNTAYLTDICESFSPFAGTIATFRDYCKGESVQEITGDNGLLRDLALGNSTVKPTPAPTNYDYYRNEIIPSATPIGISSAASVSMALSTLTAIAAIVATG